MITNYGGQHRVPLGLALATDTVAPVPLPAAEPPNIGQYRDGQHRGSDRKIEEVRAGTSRQSETTRKGTKEMEKRRKRQGGMT